MIAVCDYELQTFPKANLSLKTECESVLLYSITLGKGFILTLAQLTYDVLISCRLG